MHFVAKKSANSGFLMPPNPHLSRIFVRGCASPEVASQSACASKRSLRAIARHNQAWWAGGWLRDSRRRANAADERLIPAERLRRFVNRTTTASTASGAISHQRFTLKQRRKRDDRRGDRERGEHRDEDRLRAIRVYLRHALHSTRR